MNTPLVINRTLLEAALENLSSPSEKDAFVPAGGAPAGGAPPMDPSTMGGAPPMDPSTMGGAPPMDPNAMGGAGGMPAAPGMAPPAAPAAPAPGAPGAAPGKSTKVDPAVIDAKLWQILKAMTAIMGHLGIPISPDMMLGPAPDPMMLQQAQQSNQVIDNSAAQGAQGIPMAQGGDPAAQQKTGQADDYVPVVGEGFNVADLLESLAPFATSEFAAAQQKQAAARTGMLELLELCRTHRGGQ